MKISSTLSTILVAALVGFLAGIGGYAISRAYGTNIPSFLDFYLPNSAQVGNREIIIQEAKKVIVEQETRIGQVLEKAEKSQYGIYRKKTIAKDSIQNFYGESDLVAQAVAVTSDGWMIASFENIYTPGSLVVAKGQDVFPVTTILKDQISGLSFLKVEASGLPVIEFAPLESVISGQTVLVYDLLQNANDLLSINDVRLGSAVHTIEDYSHRLRLSHKLTSNFNSVPALNLNGQIVAYVLRDDLAVKSSYINFMLKSLLKDQKLLRPYLGVSYIMSDDMVGVDLKGQSGAVVVKNTRQDLLQVGDIITAVENIQLSGNLDLADAIFDFRIGNTVKLQVVRNGERREIEYLLAEIK